jgi:hypothetical protein
VLIAKAQELDAILLSLKGDFPDSVAYPPAGFKGIIAHQVLNHPETTSRLLERLERHLSLHPHMPILASRSLWKPAEFASGIERHGSRFPSGGEDIALDVGKLAHAALTSRRQNKNRR